MKFEALGIDRAIALTLINRGWIIIAGPLSVLFIIRELTPLEQGFYYTISSVLGLQVFFELGLGFVVLQTVSHLMSDLKLQRNTVSGNAEVIGKLGRFLADIFRLYAAISVVFVSIVIVGGAWFLSKGALG